MSKIDVVNDEVFLLDGASVGIDVLANDTVAPSGSLRLISVGQPSEGRIEKRPDGTVFFTAPEGWTGIVGATYTVAAADGTRASGSIRIVVGAPIARPDSITLDDYRPRAIDVLINDLATPGGQLEVLGFSQVDGGFVERGDAGSLIFTPKPGFVGLVTFTYEVIDEAGRTALGEVTVNIPAAAAATGIDRARAMGSDLLSVGVGSSELASPTSEAVPGAGEQGLVLFVGAVFQQLGALRLPLLQAALAVLWAGVFAGLLLPYSRRSSLWRVDGVARQDTLGAVSSPGEDATVFQFAADATNIWSTGRTRRAQGRRWRKVDTPNGPGWLPIDHLRRARATQPSRTPRHAAG